MQAYLGELAALGAVTCWTLNAVVFESAGKSVGSLVLNYFRLILAFCLLSVAAFLTRGLAFPVDATAHAWGWLLISGLFGFVLGDLFLFQAYVEVGSRVALLVMSASPPITALLSFLLLGERISSFSLLGILVTMVGIGLVILSRSPKQEVALSRPIKGLFFAGLGALGQALGLVASKMGMGSYNVFAATQIRIIAAVVGLTLIVARGGKWGELAAALKQKVVLGQIALGAVLGPFVGVSLSLLAVQHTATGVVSSITSISPVLIIPFSIFVFKEKVLFREVLGAALSILGVVILFLQ